jgi:uncharacterized membrane protein YcaP (DUF421 family)
MDNIIRIIAVYVFILFALRAIGKRELSQLSPIELVTLLLIPEIVTEALHREDYSLTNAFIGVSTLLTLVWIVSLLTYRFEKLGHLIHGKPTIVVKHGGFVVENMDKERIPSEEIMSEMHKLGIKKIDEVQWVILGSDGKLAFIPKDEQLVPPRDSGEIKK